MFIPFLFLLRWRWRPSDEACTSGQLVVASRESQYKVFHFHHGGLDKLADVFQQWKYCAETHLKDQVAPRPRALPRGRGGPMPQTPGCQPLAQPPSGSEGPGLPGTSGSCARGPVQGA